MTGHPHHHETHAPFTLALVTVSDTRDHTNDTSGAALQSLLQAAGYDAPAPVIVKDDVEAIRGAVLLAVEGGARVVVLQGGTGVSPRDNTPEAVRPLLDKELPGFGELFRALSFQEVGPAAFLSRALAGTRGRCFIACLPGSTAAVRLATERLLVPQLKHVVGMLGA
jgi:molybdenum cofactor biosynthesis protein B